MPRPRAPRRSACRQCRRHRRWGPRESARGGRRPRRGTSSSGRPRAVPTRGIAVDRQARPCDQRRPTPLHLPNSDRQTCNSLRDSRDLCAECCVRQGPLRPEIGVFLPAVVSSPPLSELVHGDGRTPMCAEHGDVMSSVRGARSESASDEAPAYRARTGGFHDESPTAVDGWGCVARRAAVGGWRWLWPTTKLTSTSGT